MNLHAIVSGPIGAINPFVWATIKRSTGYVTNPDGSRTPTYTTFPISCQVQSLGYTDLMKLDSLNIQGVRNAIYISGQANGLVRVAQKGGDVIIFPVGVMPEGTTWLCAVVLENWPDWTKIAVTLLNV